MPSVVVVVVVVVVIVMLLSGSIPTHLLSPGGIASGAGDSCGV